MFGMLIMLQELHRCDFWLRRRNDLLTIIPLLV
jgi:hypothetical protein